MIERNILFLVVVLTLPLSSCSLKKQAIKNNEFQKEKLSEENKTLNFLEKKESKNLGSIDYDALIKGNLKESVVNKNGKYFLYRVGDAVSSRNIHASIYDSLRICKNL